MSDPVQFMTTGLGLGLILISWLWVAFMYPARNFIIVHVMTFVIGWQLFIGGLFVGGYLKL